RTDLANLGPRALWQPLALQLESEREARPRGLARERDCDDRAGALVEDVVAEYQHWATASLLVAAHRVEVRPPDLSPQYSGQVSLPPAKPSSAKAFSSLGSSFAASRASRALLMRPNFSARADSKPWLRFAKRCSATMSSSSATKPASTVIAILVFAMASSV